MLLALDTTGPYCSAALFDNNSAIASLSENLGRGHAERLMPLLEELLRTAKLEWSDITQIACTTGPGSFTGLRVGLATARGLALALGCDCRGVSVFDAFAHGQKNPLKRPFAVTIDARRDQIWMQVYDANVQPRGEPTALAAGDVFNHLPEDVVHLIGSAAPAMAEQSARFTVLDASAPPPIEGVARAAFVSGQEGQSPTPLYLRAPDAKPQTKPEIQTGGFATEPQMP